MANQQEDITYKSPIYLQLREVVRSKIEEGEYAPGCAIPSENELAEIYGVNRLTVRNAIEALVTEGLLLRIQGKGAFVVGKPIVRDLDSLGGFKQTMKERQSTPSCRVLDKIKRPAGPKFAKVFDIEEDDEIFYIRRLQLADNEPVAIDTTYVPVHTIPELEDVDLSVFGMYETYAFYGITPTYAYETLDLCPLEAHSARLLNVEPGQSVLLFSCKTYDSDNKIIEYSQSLTRSDKCVFTVHNSND